MAIIKENNQYNLQSKYQLLKILDVVYFTTSNHSILTNY